MIVYFSADFRDDWGRFWGDLGEQIAVALWIV